MDIGKRNLSKLALPDAIRITLKDLDIFERAMKSFFNEVLTLVLYEDKAVLEKMELKEALEYIDIELYMTINQWIAETIANNKQEHIPGNDCPICNHLLRIELCSDWLLSAFQNAGKIDKYSKIIQFRCEATEDGRTLH